MTMELQNDTKSTFSTVTKNLLCIKNLEKYLIYMVFYEIVFPKKYIILLFVIDLSRN